MQFLFPAFLAALAALAIPIIVHLFYFRRFKKVYFTNVRFLKEVKEETSNRRKLRNLLVLLMRCLAIALMVLAFAQPYIPTDKSIKRGEQAASIFIDNSFSMNALSKDAPLLEIAKQRARDIVAAHSADTRFQVLTCDFEGRDQRMISREDALNRIEEIRQSPVSRDLSKVLTRQQQCLATGKADHKTAFVLSDFQKNISDLKQFSDTLIDVNLVPIHAIQEKNVSIDSVWFESPVQILNQPSNLLVKISNRSEDAAEEVRLSLLHDGQTKPVGSLSLQPKSSRTDTVAFTILHAGWHEAKLSLTDYPVQFDDDYYLNFYVPEEVKVLTINGFGDNKYLSNVFSGVKFFRMDKTDVRAIDYSKFGDYQLIILNDLAQVSSGLVSELKKFTENGGNVLVFPAQNADAGSYNGLCAAFEAGNFGSYEAAVRQASQINTEEFLFKDVFLNKNANLRLPTSQGNFKLAPGRGEQILTYRDGTSMLSKYAAGEGAMYLSAVSLDAANNDLVRNGEIFVPLLFRAAIAGAKTKQIAFTIGKDEVLESNHQISASGESVYKLKALRGENIQNPAGAVPEFIPEQRILGSKVLLTPGKQVDAAGWYRLALKQDSTLSEFAFNYDRKESDLQYHDETTLREASPERMKILDASAEANLGQIVGEQNQGIVLWRWCVIFALLFLALEVLFLRLWKV